MVDYGALWDGFEPVSLRINREQKTLKDIGAWWAKRAAIEDAYGKSLIKLGKAPIGKGEQGTIAQTLEALRREAEETGSLHSQFAATIKMELSKGTDSFYTGQKKTTSKTMNRGLTLTKNLANAKIKEAKSKDGYYRYAQQAKFDERFAKKAADCDQDYYKRVQTLRDCQSQFYYEMPGVLSDLQRVDEQSLDQMQRTWDSFVGILERNIPALQDIVNALKKGLEVFDKDRDMHEFYDKCYTGNDKPPLAEYEPYDKGQKESYSTSNTWGGKSSNSGGGSDFGYSKSSTFSANPNSNGSYHREPLQLTGPKQTQTKTGGGGFGGKKRHSRLSTLFTAPTEVVAASKDFDPESYYDQKNFYNNSQDQSYGGETYKYNALYEFVGDASDELSLMPGDVLDVYAEEGGWLFGTNQRGEKGRFPASYCQYAP